MSNFRGLLSYHSHDQNFFFASPPLICFLAVEISFFWLLGPVILLARVDADFWRNSISGSIVGSYCWSNLCIMRSRLRIILSYVSISWSYLWVTSLRMLVWFSWPLSIASIRWSIDSALLSSIATLIACDARTDLGSSSLSFLLVKKAFFIEDSDDSIMD